MRQHRERNKNRVTGHKGNKEPGSEGSRSSRAGGVENSQGEGEKSYPLVLWRVPGG